MKIKTKYDIGDIVYIKSLKEEFEILSIFIKKFRTFEDISYIIKEDPFFAIPESNIDYKLRNKYYNIKSIDKIVRNSDNPRWLPSDEPDGILFEYRGHICIVYRETVFLSLCGYVLLNKYFYERHLKDILNINVHGGITYCKSLKDSDYLLEEFKSTDELNKIDMETKVIGFDCCHAGDTFHSIYSAFNDIKRNSTYKTVNFVTNELTGMVDQIIEIGKRNGGVFSL